MSEWKEIKSKSELKVNGIYSEKNSGTQIKIIDMSENISYLNVSNPTEIKILDIIAFRDGCIKLHSKDVIDVTDLSGYSLYESTMGLITPDQIFQNENDFIKILVGKYNYAIVMTKKLYKYFVKYQNIEINLYNQSVFYVNDIFKYDDDEESNHYSTIRCTEIDKYIDIVDILIKTYQKQFNSESIQIF